MVSDGAFPVWTPSQSEAISDGAFPLWAGPVGYTDTQDTQGYMFAMTSSVGLEPQSFCFRIPRRGRNLRAKMPRIKDKHALRLKS